MYPFFTNYLHFHQHLHRNMNGPDMYGSSTTLYRGKGEEGNAVLCFFSILGINLFLGAATLSQDGRH